MGYRIFVLCLRQLFVNWKIALRLSWIWASVIIVSYLGFLLITRASFVNITDDGGDNGMMAISHFLFLLMWLGLFFAFTVGAASIAIGWHRYVLRGEIPGRFYVLPSKKTFWPYVWRGLKIGLKVLIVIVLPLIFVSFVIFSIMQENILGSLGGISYSFIFASTVFGIILSTLVLWVFFRLGLGLPGNAVGQDLRSGASWKLTHSASGALFTTAFLVAILQTIPSVMATLFAVIFPIQPSGIVESMLSGSALFWNLLPVPLYLAFYVVSFFVGFGILTVIYGHLQEGKSI